MNLTNPTHYNFCVIPGAQRPLGCKGISGKLGLTKSCDPKSFQHQVSSGAISNVAAWEGSQGYAQPLYALYEPHQGIALPFKVEDVIRPSACNGFIFCVRMPIMYLRTYLNY